jgi:hypothetical protein
MGIVEGEQLPDCLRLDPVVPSEPVDAFFSVNEQIDILPGAVSSG